MSGSVYVLDAYAVLALLEDEPGAAIVTDILQSETAELQISSINLGEVYYILLRRRGEHVAEEVLQNTLLEEALTLQEASWSRVKEAARIKARGGLSYADCFALALAQERGAPLLTGDPEMRAVAAQLGVQVIWLGESTPGRFPAR